jgi:hypothetical protein
VKTQALLEVLDCSSNASEITDRMLYGSVKQTRKDLAAVIGSCTDNNLVESMLSIFNSMPEAFRSRLLASGELVECLTNFPAYTNDNKSINTDAAFKELHNILRREELICALLTGESASYTEFVDLGEGPIWSPLGDWMAFRADNNWKLKQLPKIGNAISVDFDSPLASRHEPRSGILNEQKLVFTDDEISDVLKKLNNTLNNIDQVVPEFGALIRNFTRRIILRKSAEKIKESKSFITPLGSESVPRQPGIIRILNPHCDECTVTSCMETLLHESTHNFLVAWEMMNGQFVPIDDQNYRPVSPWSGNPIPNASFVHAVFVYYACHALFSSIPKRIDLCEGVNIEEAKVRLSSYAAGFLIKREVSQMLILKNKLDTSLLETLDAMGTRIHDFYKPYAEHKALFAGSSAITT